MRYWIFPTSKHNYTICNKYNVFGVDERYKVSAQSHINKGDKAIFYIKKYDRGQKVLHEPIFIGPYTINDKGVYNPDHPAVREWDPVNTYTYIIPLKPEEQIFICKLSDVFDKLLFLTNRKKGKGGFSDHFQFSIISIRDRDEDFETILNNGRKIDKRYTQILHII